MKHHSEFQWQLYVLQKIRFSWCDVEHCQISLNDGAQQSYFYLSKHIENRSPSKTLCYGSCLEGFSSQVTRRMHWNLRYVHYANMRNTILYLPIQRKRGSWPLNHSMLRSLWSIHQILIHRLNRQGPIPRLNLISK
jgi:hypothetical protein